MTGGTCGLGGSAGLLLIGRLVVQSLASLVSVSYPSFFTEVLAGESLGMGKMCVYCRGIL